MNISKAASSTDSAESAHEADRFLFISGRFCLDFVHTGGAGERQVFEEWHSPDDLAEWLAASPLQLSGITITPSDLERAYALREAIWHTALACLRHTPLPAASIRLINQFAAVPDLAPLIDGKRLSAYWSAPLTLSAALSTVARDAVTLFSGEQARLIRQCSNPKCLLLFVDASRPGNRRWCSMDRCGNRAKVTTYRQRRSRHIGAPQGG